MTLRRNVYVLAPCICMLSGAWLCAEDAAPAAAGCSAAKSEVKPKEKRVTQLPIPGEAFVIENSAAFLILPEGRDAANATPWVWYAPTLERRYPGREEAWMFEQFLAKGIAIAGVDVGESYGSPAGVAIYSALHEELVANRGMSKQPCLLARSRGGLMLYNWAAANPSSVACIAGIYPVCNLASYPGLGGACSAYGLTKDELARQLDKHNPIERLAPLAEAGVPIFHIHGDKDGTVPLEKNSGVVGKRYDALGGKMTLNVVEGGGHTVDECWFRSQTLVDFVIEHAADEYPHRTRVCAGNAEMQRDPAGLDRLCARRHQHGAVVAGAAHLSSAVGKALGVDGGLL